MGEETGHMTILYPTTVVRGGGNLEGIERRGQGKGEGGVPRLLRTGGMRVVLQLQLRKSNQNQHLTPRGEGMEGDQSLPPEGEGEGEGEGKRRDPVEEVGRSLLLEVADEEEEEEGRLG